MRAAMAQATEDKNAAMAQAERTASKAKLADRLINGLAGEFQRWTQTIKQMTTAEGAQPPCPGDGRVMEMITPYQPEHVLLALQVSWSATRCSRPHS